MIGKLFKARYELVGLLQDGAIFATYAARDKIQGRDLSIRVVKAPFSHEKEFVARLAAIVQKYGAVQSANVERLQSVEVDDGIPFILGDLTRGPSLADRIRKLAPFSIPVSVGTAISILHALDSVHRAGLVHGDLNPQNLAVMADGDVRLQSTGIWEAYSASPTAGVMVLPGMAPYLAPEVSAGAMPSSSSDVYAVGILLYELISGRSPYHADTSLAMAFQHSTAPTPSLRALSLAVPVVLDEIVKKAMAKDPRQRYVAAADMLVDLRLLQDALRFGRSLTWPLRPETVQAGPMATGRGPAVQPQPVAPRMSAIRRVDDSKRRERSSREERDVPLWMWVIFTIGSTLVVACVGMWIFQNLSRPVWITVPNVKSLSVAQATNLLRESKLTLRIARHEPSEKVEQDSILESDPEAGQKVREGGLVSVTVSSGHRLVEVPDLQNYTVDKAKATLGKLNLILSDTVTPVADPKIEPGRVVRSDPAARAMVERQTPVRVYVSSGPEGDVPDASASQNMPYVYTLHFDLKDRSRRTLVRVEMKDEAGTRTIHQKMHAGGEAFDILAKGQYSKATFSVYFDGVLYDSEVKPDDSSNDQTNNQTIQPTPTSTDGGNGQ